MNRFIKYAAAACLCLPLGSCSDFIDNAPDDTLTLEMVFNDRVRTYDWLSGVYNKIPDPWFGLLMDYGYDCLGDDLDPSQRWSEYDWIPLQYTIGEWYTDSDWNGKLWSDCPRRIRSAYIFIENAHALPDQGLSEEDVTTMKNECRFLIAYYYWLMLEAYGGVPFFDGLVDVSSPDLMRGQQTFDWMVDWIDGQLQALSQVLPDSWLDVSAQYYGRATSIMCLAVRARMLLFAASPLVNGNSWYEGFTNSDGQERFDSVYDPEKWTRAAEACKELIDAAHAAGHALNVDLNDDGTIDPFMSCYNVFMKRGDTNPEILFARPDGNYQSFDGHCTPRGASGNGGLGVYQTLVDAFFMKDGTSPVLGYNGSYGSPVINTVSGYDESGFSSSRDIRKTKFNLYRNCPGATVDSVGTDGAVYNQVAATGTFNMYVNREPRFYLTVMWNRQWYHQAGRETMFMSGEADGGPSFDAPQGGYLNRKKVSLEMNERDGQHPYRPGILYRLAEAYLSYAEALNESDPGNPDILIYLNYIRRRAGIPEYYGAGVSSGTDSNGFSRIALTGQDNVRQAIYKERRVELCCESGIRYFDLRRLKMAEEVLDRPMFGMNFSGTELSANSANPASYFKRTQYMTRVYERKYYWFPIHQTEIDKDPTLVQAPFWN